MKGRRLSLHVNTQTFPTPLYSDKAVSYTVAPTKPAEPSVRPNRSLTILNWIIGTLLIIGIFILLGFLYFLRQSTALVYPSACSEDNERLVQPAAVLVPKRCEPRVVEGYAENTDDPTGFNTDDPTKAPFCICVGMGADGIHAGDPDRYHMCTFSPSTLDGTSGGCLRKNYFLTDKQRQKYVAI